jgi:hypothetical protein
VCLTNPKSQTCTERTTTWKQATRSVPQGSRWRSLCLRRRRLRREVSKILEQGTLVVGVNPKLVLSEVEVSKTCTERTTTWKQATRSVPQGSRWRSLCLRRRRLRREVSKIQNRLTFAVLINTITNGRVKSLIQATST